MNLFIFFFQQSFQLFINYKNLRDIQVQLYSYQILLQLYKAYKLKISEKSEIKSTFFIFTMSKYKREKQFMFSQKKINDVQLFLNDLNNIDISIIKDQKLNTVLHQCSLQGSLKIMYLYIQYMKKYWRIIGLYKDQIQIKLKNWINEANKEGFTCLHFAAYKGWVQILAYLENLGANYKIQTNSGLGVLHLAAQGDRVKTFIFYRKKLDINGIDKKGITPLHWAAFQGSQKVSEYLISQEQIKINAVDQQGQTPLHLATAQGYTKIVRRLLLAGADRHIKNKQGQEPIQIAKKSQYHNIQNFLNDDYTWLDYIKFFMNIKIKYMPRQRSIKMPLLFHLAYILLLVFITLGLDYQEEYIGIFYGQCIFFGLILLIYWTLIVKPKQRKKGDYQNILKQNLPVYDSSHGFINSKSLLSSGYSDSFIYNNDINVICLRCVQYKPTRSYHCDICRICIQQYDHHCPWINNCVGKHNIFRFVTFVILVFIALNWLFFICVHSFLVIVEQINDEIRLFRFNEFLLENLYIIYIFIGIVTFLQLFFIIPLFILMCVQIMNLLIGKTTYERFSKSNQSILSRSQAQFVRKSSGFYSDKKQKISCKNCINMCYRQSGQQQRLLK